MIPLLTPVGRTIWIFIPFDLHEEKDKDRSGKGQRHQKNPPLLTPLPDCHVTEPSEIPPISTVMTHSVQRNKETRNANSLLSFAPRRVPGVTFLAGICTPRRWKVPVYQNRSVLASESLNHYHT